MGFLRFITQDFLKNSNNTKGKIICFLFRVANYSRENSTLIRIVFLPYRIFYKIIGEYMMGFEIPFDTNIGRGIKVLHGFGIVINKKSIIGQNLTIRQNTTIGNARGGGKCPTIEDNVTIGANSIIIGEIVIGENSIIGAGSVVIKSVAPNSVVAGNPAKFIKHIGGEAGVQNKVNFKNKLQR